MPTLPASAPYRRFTAWEAAHQLTQVAYRVTAEWPKSELYGLTQQARRAAVSIEVNIAEGSARRGSREFAHFLSISYGSLTELQCLGEIALALGFAEPERITELEREITRTGRFLWRLLLACRKAVEKQRCVAPVPGV